MSIKTILAVLNTTETAEAALKAAVVLAREHDAHLIGLHVIESMIVYPGIAVTGASAVMSALEESERIETEAIRALFDRYVANVTIPVEWRAVRRGASPIGSRAIESGQAADLIVAARPGNDIGRDMLDSLIRRSGRPVLVVPPDFDAETIGHALLIGWSATREASRAAFDALAIARQGATCAVLTVSRSATPDPTVAASAKELAAALDRQGLKMTVVHRARDGADVSDVLKQEAFERGADVIVSGAYGHSLAYDFVLGAVTRNLMATSPVPVLFSK